MYHGGWRNGLHSASVFESDEKSTQFGDPAIESAAGSFGNSYRLSLSAITVQSLIQHLSLYAIMY